MGVGTAPIMTGHPWFAATYDFINRWSEQRLMPPLREHIAGEATGEVLEIGAGTGANFPYYRDVKRLVATEPDPYMLPRAQRRARELGLPVELFQCPAEALPFADASFGIVVATLVLCTVNDQAGALREVRRVLKPGGTFRFIEHVRARSSRVAHWQERLTPLWRRIGAGCHLNRATAESVTAAGFTISELEERNPMPLTPFIIGVARPRAAGPARAGDHLTGGSMVHGASKS